MKAKKKAVAVLQPQVTSPADTIYAAVNKNTDLSKLKEAMELQFSWERRQSEKAYNKAIAVFKANPPEIVKESKVDFKSERTGQRTNYRYASLANVIEKVTPELSKHGLTISWRTSINGKINVTCRISHELGHFEETTLSSDAETSGTKNAIQAMGSAITYMQRYTALALLGLACSDSDDDGRAAGPAVQEAKAEIVNQPSLLDRIKEDARKKFSDPDDFKAWRVDHNLVENLTKASEFELAKVWNFLRVKETVNANN